MLSLLSPALLSPLAEMGIYLLFDLAIKGTVIMIGGLVLTITLTVVSPRSSAAARHLVWSLSLLSLLALPALSVLLPSWQVPILPQALLATPAPEKVGRSVIGASAISSPPYPSLPEAAQLTFAARQAEGLLTAPLQFEASLAESNGMAQEPKAWNEAWLRWALIVWFGGMVVVLTQLAIGLINLQRMIRRATPVTDPSWNSLLGSLLFGLRITRRVRLLKNNQVMTPMTHGVLWAGVLLPADVDQWSDERRHMVLLHELAHVKRWDCLTQRLAHIVRAIYWFNPLVWVATRQMEMERERACDNQVLSTGTGASDYASHLLDVARSLRSAPYSQMVTAAIVRRSQLECRLRSILNPKLSRRGLTRTTSIFVGVILACVVMPLAALRPISRASHLINREAAANMEEFAPVGFAVQAQYPVVATSAFTNQANEKNADVPGKQPVDPFSHGRTQTSEARTQYDEPAKAQPHDEKPGTEKASDFGQRSEDAQERLQKVLALIHSGHPSAAEELKTALADKDGQVRAQAAWGLGMIGDQSAVQPLITALRDKDSHVRAQAAWALGMKGDSQAVEPLISVLKDTDALVRAQAAWALGMKGDGRAVEHLIETLKDADSQVRAQAAFALGMKGDRRAVEALDAALNDESRLVRKQATWALAAIAVRSLK